MTWLFWTSYGILWVVVVILGAGMIVMLREHADLLLGSREGRSRLHGPPDGTTVPPLEGEEVRLAATTPGRPRVVLFMAVTCEPCWRRRAQISHFAADQAEAVETVVWHPVIAGAVVDPETGCYAVLRKSEAGRVRRVARIYADSALVFTRDAESTTEGGVERTVMYTGANRVCGGGGGGVRRRRHYVMLSLLFRRPGPLQSSDAGILA